LLDRQIARPLATQDAIDVIPAFGRADSLLALPPVLPV